MAKKSSIAKNLKKLKNAVSNFKTRQALKELNRNGSIDEQEASQIKMQKNRNGSLCRVRNRCNCCRRPRGTYKKFGLCRICLREAVMRGDVPGVRKASW